MMLKKLSICTILIGANMMIMGAGNPNAVPGEKYDEIVVDRPGANSVSIAGDWNQWAGSSTGNFNPSIGAMVNGSDGFWHYPASKIPVGKHEYKFIVNGDWEGGNNHIMNIDQDGKFYIPIEYFKFACIDDTNKISIRLNTGKSVLTPADFSLDPPNIISDVLFESSDDFDLINGYRIENKNVVFLFKPEIYEKTVPPGGGVSVCGSFNNWADGITHSSWQLKKDDSNGIWNLTVSADRIFSTKNPVFKFVIHSSGNVLWVSPHSKSSHILDDGAGNINTLISKSIEKTQDITIITTAPLDITKSNYIIINNLSDKAVRNILFPRDIFQKEFISDKTLGVVYSSKEDKTTFRVFSPRAWSITLKIFDEPDTKEVVQQSLKKDIDGTWDVSLPGTYFNKYYRYIVSGPSGDGEGFESSRLLSDPYADANLHRDGPSIIIDHNELLDKTGWTDGSFKTPSIEDFIIYEVHVRDLTSLVHELPENLRSKYLSLVKSKGTGKAIDHINDLGINAVEFLPVFEFDDDPPGTYHWGYMTSFYFAPESSFALDPLHATQVKEFKTLVNFLHENGISVILDVVYNHTGWPNLLGYYDKKYFYRLNDDLTDQNFSGCGNDFKSENPMSRKLIIDSLKHWIKNYHIDGFRFDLAELIDIDTLRAIETETRKIKQDLILIAEPWSFRGNIKGKLRNSGWAYWNDEFRNGIKDFVKGRADRTFIKKVIAGSVDIFTDNPAQSINYLESHDDMTLADDITHRPDSDGRLSLEDDLTRNRLSAVCLFTSLGVPMLAGGQEFLRSKHGINNSYNKGDEINGFDWEYAAKHEDLKNFYKELIRFRKSPAGAALRYKTNPSKNYIEWFMPASSGGLGYMLNADSSLPTAPRVLVLINVSDIQVMNFDVDIPPADWVPIVISNKADAIGLEEEHLSGGKQIIPCEPLTAKIYVEKK